MKSFLACLTIALFWAVLYLPGLGTREIRGEEWRRTLPARTMLNTGEWIVTYSGGLPYFRKPPLINWVSAASFKLTGVQNEWTARLPSALLMLGAGLGVYAYSRRVMGGSAAFVGTMFFLGSIGSIEKGRIAEIEVYYIALTALAFAAWLAGFMGKLNRWVAWLSAGFFLGLALLSKGPMHLLFFYCIVIGACWTTRRWAELRSGPHLVGLALCLGMFLLWAVPFMRDYGQLIEAQPWLVKEPKEALAGVPTEAPRGAWAAWKKELASRVTGEEESSTKDWLVRGPRALLMFLPWVLFLPLWWKKEALKSAFPDDDTLRAYRGMCWGIIAGFLIMVLLPSSSPRYVAPLLGPVALLLGWIVTLQKPERAAVINKAWRWIAGTLAVLAVLTLVGAMFVTFVPPEPVPPTGWQLGILIVGLVAGLLGMRSRLAATQWPPAVRSCFLTLSACALLIFGYCWLGLSVASKRESVRPTGLAIREAMTPKDGPLYVFHLGQVPYPFYFPPNSIELSSIQQLPDQGVKWLLTNVKVERDFGLYFERRYGKAVRREEFSGKWGASDQNENRRMVLLRYEGKDGVNE